MLVRDSQISIQKSADWGIWDRLRPRNRDRESHFRRVALPPRLEADIIARQPEISLENVTVSGTATLPDTFANFKPAPAAGKDAIKHCSYSHDAMIDMIVANPWINQGELARNFGYTEGWVSQVIASNAFQARLEERKDALIDPAIRATIEENFRGLVHRSIQILMRKLDEPTSKISDELALKALEIASKAAGYGAKGSTVQVNTQFVVQVPAKAASSADWVKQNSAGGQTVTSSPAIKAPQRTEDAVLVASGSAAPTLLEELKSS